MFSQWINTMSFNGQINCHKPFSQWQLTFHQKTKLPLVGIYIFVISLLANGSSPFIRKLGWKTCDTGFRNGLLDYWQINAIFIKFTLHPSQYIYHMLALLLSYNGTTGMKLICLSHLPQVPHICIGELGCIGSGNGLSPVRRQAITWTNAFLLSIRPLRTNFSEIWIKIQNFSLRKCPWKCRLQNGGHIVQGEMSYCHN